MRLRAGLLVVLLFGVVAVFLGLRADDGDDADTPEDRPAPTAADIAADLDCGDVRELAFENAPISGRAATGGVACSIGDSEVHIFDRAPLGAGDGGARGGRLGNIDRLVGTSGTGCLSLLVGPTWFILANEEQILTGAESTLGGAERAIVRATPPASYVGPGGCGSN